LTLQLKITLSVDVLVISPWEVVMLTAVVILTVTKRSVNFGMTTLTTIAPKTTLVRATNPNKNASMQARFTSTTNEWEWWLPRQSSKFALN
jgi:hypothetical protein